MATTSKCDTQPEYIERNKVYELIGQTGVARIHVSDIDVIPSADVIPVRHGMWETIDASTWRWSHDGAKPVHRVKYRHNECGRVVQRKEPYCPNCGAKMDLEG